MGYSTYHWGTYRKLRNFVNREIKSSKSNYYCNLIEEGKGDSSLSKLGLESSE